MDRILSCRILRILTYTEDGLFQVRLGLKSALQGLEIEEKLLRKYPYSKFNVLLQIGEGHELHCETGGLDILSKETKVPEMPGWQNLSCADIL